MFTTDVKTELARLALYAYDYRNGPSRDVYNRTGIPEGWELYGEGRADRTGFLASAFLNESGTQLVVSFAGTRFDSNQSILSEPDWRTNYNGFFGEPPQFQFGDAVDYFAELMRDPNIPDEAKQNIVFTGHSLGGGLANFMGVMFDVPSFSFAPAPFRWKATKETALEYLEW